MTWLGRATLVVAIAAAIGFAHTQLPDEPVATGDAAFVPGVDLVRVASFGFDSLVADYYWMRAIQIVGSEAGPRGRNAELGALVDLVTQLDPWVDHPYRFAAVWLTDDETAVRQANEILEQGIEVHPDDWRNRFYLGFNHFFYLGDQEKAADVLEPTLRLEGSPAYLGRLVSRLRAESGGLDAAAAFLLELARQAPDEYARVEYLKALDEIEVERHARYLDQARAEYVRRHRRDIERVEDLVLVEPRVLSRLPPEPHGWEWVLDEPSGRIISSYIGFRYELKIDAMNRQLIEEFHGRSRAVSPGQGEG